MTTCPTNCPHCGRPIPPIASRAEKPQDGRSQEWLCSVALFQAKGRKPVLETEAEPFHGLPAIATGLAQLIAAFHESPMPIPGASADELHHLLRGLRVTISRRGGNDAVWRVRYIMGSERWRAEVTMRRVQP